MGKNLEFFLKIEGKFCFMPVHFFFFVVSFSCILAMVTIFNVLSQVS